MTDLAKLFEEHEWGNIDRRHLLQALSLGATAAFAAGVFEPSVRVLAAGAGQASRRDRAFPVTTVNHLSYSSPSYAKTRDFYIDLLGMRVAWDDGQRSQVDFGSTAEPNSFYFTQGQAGAKPTAGHISYGVPNFWAVRTAMREEMERRGLQVRADGEAGWTINGASGYQIQPVPVKDPAMFPGAAGPCEVAKSDKCKAAYEVGLNNLGSMPKPSGKGFRATYFKYIIIHVPDVAKERDFYTSLFGMKVVSDRPDDCALRFGQNTLVLRPAGAGGKPYCNEFGFVIENYNEASARAELQRRGFNPKPGAFGGLAFNDLNGLPLEVAGP